VRVVAGTARGRRLRAPNGLETRPTSDRVREAVFNALASMDAITGTEVLDLFAGTGALGIEALSRGAARCTFVEWAARPRGTVVDNLETVGLAEQSTVSASDAWAFLARSTVHFDLILLDPPYDFDRWEELSAASAVRARVGGVLVIEAPQEVTLGEGWDVRRLKRYGGTVVQIARLR